MITIIIAALMVVSICLAAYSDEAPHIYQRTPSRRGVPHMKNAPPPPPRMKPHHIDDLMFDQHMRKFGESRRIDYTLKNGETVWFSFKVEPRDEDDWKEAKIIDLNWAHKCASLQLKGYRGVMCCGIAGLSKERWYVKD